MAGSRQRTYNWNGWLRAALSFAVFVGLTFFSSGPLAAQSPAAGHARGDLKTGPALQRELGSAISVAWSDRDVRGALVSLSKSTGIAIFLDRRIDPDRKIALNVAGQPLQTLLDKIAAESDGSVVIVGSVVYIGPRETAGKLATLAALKRQQIGKLPNQVKARLLKSDPWAWDELAEPAQLVSALALRGGVVVENSDVIPHDLWPAADWPALPWTDRLTLVLAGFDLTFEVDAAGKNIRLVPLPKNVVVERSYTPRGTAGKLASDLRRQFPAAKIVVAGEQVSVEASFEDHDKIQRLLSGQTVRTTKVVPGTKRYTLTVENQPAGVVLATVAKQLEKPLKYEPQLRDRLKQPVSFAAKDVTLDELLDLTLKPLGLAYNLGEQNLEIIATGKESEQK